MSGGVLRDWWPQDRTEKVRPVQVETMLYRGDKLVGVVVREVKKHLPGVALVHITELRKGHHE